MNLHGSPEISGRRASVKVRFAADSPLEGDGFELSVPRRKRRFLLSNGNRHRGDKR